MNRRGFLLAGSVAGLSSALALWLRSEGRPSAPRSGNALSADPRGVLALRQGFSYRVLEQAGQRMDDGYRVPGRPDAKARTDGHPHRDCAKPLQGREQEKRLRLLPGN